MERLDAASMLPCVDMDQDRSNTHGSLNISDVIEVLQTTDPEFVGVTTSMYSGNDSSNISSMEDVRKRSAYVKLLEQPASKALRFRYECEGRSAGSIPGANSTPENKTFPGIQIVGYKGRAVVVVSCVTKDPPYRPHPHNLVGKEGCKKGVCTMEVSNESMAVTFSNLGIQCVKKKDIEEALRVREEIRVDPYRTGFSHRSQPTSIDLNAVRLCFQVFLEGSVRGKFTFQLNPIVSDPIFDKKAMSDLVICKLSDCSCSVAGGKEIILLCEKVAKEDIQVRFYEERSGHIIWEGFGEFQPTQVHKQVAISFRSPRYSSLEVEAPTKVHIQLRRPSDGATSEPLPFEYLPLDSGRPAFWSLRKALVKKGDYTMFSSILASNTAIMTLTNADKISVEPNQAKGYNGEKDHKTNLIDDRVDPKVDDAEVDNGQIDVGQADNNQMDDIQNDDGRASDGQGDFCQVNNDQIDDNDITMIHDNNANNNMDSSNYNELTSADESCLNDLLYQVAGLDVIYGDSKARLPTPDIQDIPNTENDNQTYSSLQMAMKNPIDVLITNNKREIQLPPLPPKRIKKNPPVVPSRPSEHAPNKNLPSLPENKQVKPNLFQKLFSKRSGGTGTKKEKSSEIVLDKDKSQEIIIDKDKSLEIAIDKDKSQEVVIDKDKSQEIVFDKDRSHEIVIVKDKSQESIQQSLLGSIGNISLTEAEHLALYTDVAPHASVSEFDEMSFYYSPVEGGQIITPTKPNVVGDY